MADAQADRPDISFLPPDLQHAARFVTQGREVMWRRSEIGQVLRAVAASGRIILGLDLRSDDSDLATEVPLSAFDSSTAASGGADEALRSALEAIANTGHPSGQDGYDWVLVTW